MSMSHIDAATLLNIRGSECGYPRAVLSLEQGLTILFVVNIINSFKMQIRCHFSYTLSFKN